jgi:hypothetical protein
VAFYIGACEKQYDQLISDGIVQFKHVQVYREQNVYLFTLSFNNTSIITLMLTPKIFNNKEFGILWKS